MNRLLLPFTQGVDMQAINFAISLASNKNAILAPLSLIRLSSTPNPRLEYIQQSKDFLESVRYKAERAGVPVELIERSTYDTTQCISLLAQELACLGILLFLRQGTGVLLSTSEVKKLLEHKQVSSYLVHLAEKERKFSPLQRLAHRFKDSKENRDTYYRYTMFT